MKVQAGSKPRHAGCGLAERAFIVWVLLALAILAPVAALLDGPFPIFTVIWLAVPLIAVLCSRNARQVGWHLVPAPEFFKVTAACLGAMLLLAALVEPWSQTYQLLLQKATAGPHPDTTFAWLVRYPGISGWAGMLAYSGMVTILGEELFFRGWLLQLLRRRTGRTRAVVLQAVLFTLPQLLPALLMPVPQALLYSVIYSWLTVGIIGGWAAERTSSIFPSLLSATLLNFVLTLTVL